VSTPMVDTFLIAIFAQGVTMSFSSSHAISFTANPLGPLSPVNGSAGAAAALADVVPPTIAGGRRLPSALDSRRFWTAA
jgi:hypothetical protein